VLEEFLVLTKNLMDQVVLFIHEDKDDVEKADKLR